MAVATVEDAAAAVVDAAAVVAAAGSVIGASVEVTGGNDVVDDASVGTGPAPPVAFSVVEPTVVVTVASKSESVVLVSDAAAVDVLARHRLVCALQSHWIAWPPVHRWLCVCWGWGGKGGPSIQNQHAVTDRQVRRKYSHIIPESTTACVYGDCSMHMLFISVC